MKWLRRLRDERGSTLVEFALSSAILFASLFGIFALCGALYSYNFVADAAHDATRWAIVRGSKCTGLTVCNVSTSGPVQTYVRSLGYPGIVTNNLTATASYPNGNDPGDTVTITVTYTFPLNIPYWKGSTTLSLSSTSQMTIAQ